MTFWYKLLFSDLQLYVKSQCQLIVPVPGTALTRYFTRSGIIELAVNTFNAGMFRSICVNLSRCSWSWSQSLASSMSFAKITRIVTYPAVGEEFHSGYGRDCWGVNRVIFSSELSFREEARSFRSKVWLKLLFQGTVTWNILSPALRSYTVTTLMWWTRVLSSSSEVNASVYKMYFSGSSVTPFHLIGYWNQSLTFQVWHWMGTGLRTVLWVLVWICLTCSAVLS